MHQVAGILVGDPLVDRPHLAIELDAGQELGDVLDLGRESVRALSPARDRVRAVHRTLSGSSRSRPR